MMTLEIEESKADFDTAQFLSSLQKTWKALEEIRLQIQPGCSEEEALAIAKSTLKALGSEKQWHRLSDFPPRAYAWVLEIQIRPPRKIGALFTKTYSIDLKKISF